MRGLLFQVFVLFLLTACSAEIRTEPIGDVNKTVQEPLSCDKIKCAAPTICEEGKCVCPAGQKKCGTDCIAESGCCKDADCSEGECVDNKCKVTEECSYGEVFTEGKCECSDGYKYCEEQGKCIARDNCCTYLNCGSFQKCIRTTYGVSLCMQSGVKKSCKFVSDNGREELFNLGNGSIGAEALRFLEESVEFKIENMTVTLEPDTQIPLLGMEVWQEDFQVMGGFCRYEED
ncbi:hypothetical protein KY329_02455 [Candidatus Woesearchaeota archaeon]|nr:hypothetical protein [Candidatus Woesearchaeota archaeon]